MKKIIIVGGPTATGKTALGISLAQYFNGEIISADSMQNYKEMNIGTATPSDEEMYGITHYLINECEPEAEYNVAIFKKKANEYINKIISKGKIPIIVGGTGLYIDALLYDYNLGNTSQNTALKDELEKKLAQYGAQYMHDLLQKVDSEEAEKIHKNNTKRVLRALEIYYINHETKSENMQDKSPVFNHAYIALNFEPREILYERINKRVDEMFNQGLLNEVYSLYQKGYTEKNNSMQAIAYKELLEYFKGEMNLEEAEKLIKKRTRNYAKRQLTWFRNNKNVKFFNINEYSSKEELYLEIINYVKERLNI
jgi:tRNA dimethylallyltransferase